LPEISREKRGEPLEGAGGIPSFSLTAGSSGTWIGTPFLPTVFSFKLKSSRENSFPSREESIEPDIFISPCPTSQPAFLRMILPDWSPLKSSALPWIRPPPLSIFLISAGVR
jgi:hypothetical protein